MATDSDAVETPGGHTSAEVQKHIATTEVQSRVFASAGQKAFFEGHVHALRVLGEIPPTGSPPPGPGWRGGEPAKAG
ncbi:hypothetical protein FNV60_00030 [Streptomyces sp. RLB3-5]|nr:hypothetical protein FNV60_00030 [Streptomyces sp. RLB3-5]